MHQEDLEADDDGIDGNGQIQSRDDVSLSNDDIVLDMPNDC